jgi:hypothetical protein
LNNNTTFLLFHFQKKSLLPSSFPHPPGDKSLNYEIKIKKEGERERWSTKRERE